VILSRPHAGQHGTSTSEELGHSALASKGTFSPAHWARLQLERGRCNQGRGERRRSRRESTTIRPRTVRQTFGRRTTARQGGQRPAHFVASAEHRPLRRPPRTPLAPARAPHTGRFHEHDDDGRVRANSTDGPRHVLDARRVAGVPSRRGQRPPLSGPTTAAALVISPPTRGARSRSHTAGSSLLSSGLSCAPAARRALRRSPPVPGPSGRRREALDLVIH